MCTLKDSKSDAGQPVEGSNPLPSALIKSYAVKGSVDQPPEPFSHFLAEKEVVLPKLLPDLNTDLF